jgi:hypothetical protein
LRKIVMVVGASLAVALIAAPLASARNATSDAHSKRLAAKECHAKKKADKGAFRAEYGKHAMRNCIKGTTNDEQGQLKNAAQECRSERAADPGAFRDRYGTMHSKGRNAFGKCVSGKVRAEDKQEVAEFKNAAQECRSERAADRGAFRDRYGTMHSRGRNAFGKCVSSKVKHSGAEDTTAG